MSDWVQKQTPDPRTLYSYLKKSINKLESNSDNISDSTHHVRASLYNARKQLESGDEDRWSLKLKPYLAFNLESSRDFNNITGEARIGGNIKVRDSEYKMFSSNLILAVKHPRDGQELPEELSHCCLDTGTEESEGEFYHILERFHWDIDTGNENHENKPVCHFQTGGEVSNSAFASYENFHYCSNGLDKPRMPHPPMDPTLIFNLLINQYQSLESFNQKQWEGVINEGEKILWGPYYEATYGMAANDGRMIDLMQPTK